MDALKAEIALKRKNLTDNNDRPNKYMRRGDIEKMRLEQERKEAEETAKKKAAELEKSKPSLQPDGKVSLLSLRAYLKILIELENRPQTSLNHYLQCLQDRIHLHKQKQNLI